MNETGRLKVIINNLQLELENERLAHEQTKKELKKARDGKSTIKIVR